MADDTSTYPYTVRENRGSVMSRHRSEESALVAAETYAQNTPGTAYFVDRTLTKSVVVKPVTTTRL